MMVIVMVLMVTMIKRTHTELVGVSKGLQVKAVCKH